jgi:hypothetical protein
MLLSTSEVTAKLDRVINDLASELTTLRETSHYRQLSLPLLIAAELLSDRSVWLCECF